MKTSTFPTRAADPQLFGSVRHSRDLTLVAFATALLTAFALHAGALVPRLGGSGAPDREPAIAGSETQAPAIAATQPSPCPVPRG